MNHIVAAWNRYRVSSIYTLVCLTLALVAAVTGYAPILLGPLPAFIGLTIGMALIERTAPAPYTRAQLQVEDEEDRRWRASEYHRIMTAPRNF